MATNEQEYPPSDLDLAGCVGVESGAQTVIARRLDVGYWVESRWDQLYIKGDVGL